MMGERLETRLGPLASEEANQAPPRPEASPSKVLASEEPRLPAVRPNGNAHVPSPPEKTNDVQVRTWRSNPRNSRDWG